GQDLVTGMAELDGALKGETDLLVEAVEKGGNFEVQTLRLSNPQLDAQGRGNFAPGTMDATLNFSVPDLAVLGNGLSGGLTAEATAVEQDGARRIELTGRGTDLRLGQKDVEGALTGVTDLRLSAEQRGDEITVHDFNLTNEQMLASARGRIAPSGTDMTGQVDVKSLASLGRGWRGALTAQGSFKDDGTGARLLDVTGTGTNLSFGQTQVDGALAGETRLVLRGVERGGVLAIETATVENPRLHVGAEGQLGKG